MRLSEWAKAEGVHYQTAWRWFRDGQLPVPAIRTPSGTILVEVPRSSTTGVGRTAVYARVSSHDQRGDLDRQVARLTEWATAQGMVVSEVVTKLEDDLVRDMTEVLTSFCARLYGRRGARNRAIKALNCAKNNVGPRALLHPGAKM